MSLPDIPDSAPIAAGNDEINLTRQRMESRIQPLALGGTGGTTKPTARTGLGITSGTANPSGGADGDIYFKIV